MVELRNAKKILSLLAFLLVHFTKLSPNSQFARWFACFFEFRDGLKLHEKKNRVDFKVIKYTKILEMNDYFHCLGDFSTEIH